MIEEHKSFEQDTSRKSHKVIGLVFEVGWINRHKQLNYKNTKNVELQQSVNFGNERCHASTCILYSVHLIRMSTLSRGNQYTVYSYFGNGRCVAATCIKVLQKRILSQFNPYTHFGNKYCLKATCVCFRNKHCHTETCKYFGNDLCLGCNLLTLETTVVSW